MVALGVHGCDWVELGDYLFRGMLQDLSHLGTHGSHGTLLQLPKFAGVRAGIRILGITTHIPAQPIAFSYHVTVPYPASRGAGTYPASRGAGTYPTSRGAGTHPASRGAGTYPSAGVKARTPPAGVQAHTTNQVKRLLQVMPSRSSVLY